MGVIELARMLATQIRWEARVIDLQNGSDQRLLVCQKPFVRKWSILLWKGFHHPRTVHCFSSGSPNLPLIKVNNLQTSYRNDFLIFISNATFHRMNTADEWVLSVCYISNSMYHFLASHWVPRLKFAFVLLNDLSSPPSSSGVLIVMFKEAQKL